MTRSSIAVVLFLLWSSSASAQPVGLDKLTPELPTDGARRAAEVVSWATAIADVGFDTVASWGAPDRGRAFMLEGVRLGVTYGVVLAVKHFVHRDRPCAPDCGIDQADASFYSAHTAVAWSTVSSGKRLAFTVPLAVGTQSGRILAGKHWLTDTLVGAAAGLLTSRIR